MRIGDWSSDVCSSDLERVGQHLQFLGRAKRGIACDARENGRGACGKKCFDQSLESFHKLGTLDIAPPDSHKRIAETGQVPHSALSAHILDIIDGHSSPVPVHFRSEEHTSELQSLMRISY